MKKCLSILLALLMILSLGSMVACQKEEAAADTPAATTPAATTPDTTPPTETGAAEPAASTETPAQTNEVTQEMLENSKPNEYVMEKAAAGMNPTCAFLTASLASDVMIAMDTGLRNIFTENKINYTAVSFDADPSKLVEQLENFGTMGCALVLVVMFDDGAADIVSSLMEAGTSVASLYYDPAFEISAAICADEAHLGEVVAQMALAWVDQQYPDREAGDVKAALLRNDFNTTYIARFANVEALLTEAGVDCVYTESQKLMNVDVGYTFAENAMTSDPDIRLFITMTTGQCTGASNYILSRGYTSEELKDFGAFACDNDFALREIIDAAGKGEDAVARGLCSSGSDDPSVFVGATLMGILKGEVAFNETVHMPVYSYNSVGFEYDERI